MKEVKVGIGRIKVRFSKEGRKRRLRDLLYRADPVICGQLEEDLKVMIERFAVKYTNESI